MHRQLILACLLVCGMALAAQAQVKLAQEQGVIQVSIDSKPFTAYYFADGRGAPLLRPFLYPVLAADGTELTTDQSKPRPGEAKDHPHHRSIWVGQGAVNGADHWANSTVKQRHIQFQKVEGDTIVEELEWDGKDGQPLLRETRTLRFLSWPDGARGIDMTLTFNPTAESVTFGDTKEAGLCAVRLVKAIADTAVITNSAGATGEKECWGKPAAWCDESGQINGKMYGVAVLDHPSNPRHPSTWHVRKYGLLAANIFGLHDFDKKNPEGAGDLKMTKGQPVTFRYSVVVHTGDAKSAGLDEKFRQFTGR